MNQKRITDEAKQIYWVVENKDAASWVWYRELDRLMFDAGFLPVKLRGDGIAYIHPDYWNQSKKTWAGGTQTIDQLRAQGWFPVCLDVQFAYRQFVERHKNELQWFCNWIESRVGKQLTDAISPFSKD